MCQALAGRYRQSERSIPGALNLEGKSNKEVIINVGKGYEFGKLTGLCETRERCPEHPWAILSI